MFVFAFCQVCSGSSVQCLCGDTSTLRNFPMLTFGDVSHIFTNSQNSLRFKKFQVTRSLGMFLEEESDKWEGFHIENDKGGGGGFVIWTGCSTMGVISTKI